MKIYPTQREVPYATGKPALTLSEYHAHGFGFTLHGSTMHSARAVEVLR